MSGNARVAIVHDYFTQRGGAERVATRLAAILPDAPVYTSVYDHDMLPPEIEPARVRPSRLQGLRHAGVPLKALVALLPGALGALDLDGFDVIVSSTSAFAQHVRPPSDAVHVCYCHTPPPFLWRPHEYFARSTTTRRLVAPVLSVYRRCDARAVGEIDVLLANSAFTADRIRAAYGRDARVVHPPIDTAAFTPTTDRSGRFLVVARLRPHKDLDLAIAAANEYRLPLDVFGEGSDRARLEAIAGPTVVFHGRRNDADVAAAMARCTALIVPGAEDFGMTTAEVQAAGRPPIALAAGGACEIVCDGETGFLVPERTAAAFGAAMVRAQRTPLASGALVASARRFDRCVFDRTMRAIVAAAVRPSDVVASAGAGDRPVVA